MIVRVYLDAEHRTQIVHDDPTCRVIARLNAWRSADNDPLTLNFARPIDDMIARMKCDVCGKILRGER